jgi:hypothetical protein
LTTAVAAPRGGIGIQAPAIRAVGFVSGWGRGLSAVPADARVAAAGRDVIPLGRPTVEGERFRRATRECLWALAAVEIMLEDGAVDRAAIAGDRTALLFVTAAVYGASNRAFIERSGGGTHFAYTAPAVVSAEAAIEYGLHGPATLFIGGPPATLRAIWYAATLLAGGTCDRALVLAVETFAECADLYARARRRSAPPLVEAAGCAWLERGEGRLALRSTRAPRGAVAGIEGRLGETFACGPLAELGMWRQDGGAGDLRLRGHWRGEVADLSITKGGA